MFRLLTALITGMTAAWLFPGLLFPAGCIALPALLLLAWPGKRLSGTPALEKKGAGLLLLYVILGYLLTSIALEGPRPKSGPSLLYCKPIDTWQASNAGWKNRTYLTVRQAKGWTSYACQIILCIRRTDFAEPPTTNFLAYAQIAAPRVSHNPGAFDYAAYLKNQGILFQTFLEKEGLMPEGEPTGFKVAEWLKQSLVNGLRRCQLQPRELGLAEALLIGYRDDMDKSLTQAYSNAGVVHVIAISGLHLALIYSLLMGLIGLLPLPASWTWVKLLIVLASLWIFSFAAGGQPSVIRSAVMFSLMGIGQILARQKQTLNTLAAVAFLMLVYNPLWLRDVGFQLSFAALTGILLFQKKLDSWWTPANPLVHAVWSLCTVTLAAQVYTAPLCLYYFHQLPLLFLVSNIIIVPLSSLVLILALLAICSLPAGSIHFVFNTCQNWGLQGMNGLVTYMDHCPFLSWQGLMINAGQAVLLTLFLHFLLRGGRLSALICMLGFSGIGCLASIARQQQQGLVIYDAGRSWGLELVEGRNAILYCDSTLPDRKNFERLLKPSATSLGFHRNQIITPTACNRILFSYAGVQYLLVCGRGSMPPSQLLGRYHPEKLILTGALPAFQRHQWITAAAAEGVAVHDIPSQGAAIMLTLRPSDPASPWTKKFSQRLFQFFTKMAWNP